MSIVISIEELEIIKDSLSESSFQLNDRINQLHPIGSKLTIESIKLIINSFDNLSAELSSRAAL